VAKLGPAEVEFDVAADILAKFNFGGRFEETSFPCVSAAQRAKFQRDFVEQFTVVRDRLHKYKWLAPGTVLPPRVTSGPYQPRTDFHVFVSEVYPLSKSLVPAWDGQRGWMEFPAYRVAAGNSAITHEIVHVLFPSGGRMLAEGLAVYLQYSLFPDLSVYPNFGTPIDDTVILFLAAQSADTVYSATDLLWKMNLDALERVSTPDELGLNFAEISIGQRPGFGTGPDDQPVPSSEGKGLYEISGSFVGFLLENPIKDKLLTIDNFGALYRATPLRPLERDSGDPNRWQDHYRDNSKAYSFHELALMWKTYMHVKMSGGKKSAIPAEFAKIPLVAKLHKRLANSS
jgi:hypothetical protein